MEKTSIKISVTPEEWVKVAEWVNSLDLKGDRELVEIITRIGSIVKKMYGEKFITENSIRNTIQEIGAAWILGEMREDLPAVSEEDDLFEEWRLKLDMNKAQFTTYMTGIGVLVFEISAQRPYGAPQFSKTVLKVGSRLMMSDFKDATVSARKYKKWKQAQTSPKTSASMRKVIG